MPSMFTIVLNIYLTVVTKKKSLKTLLKYFFFVFCFVYCCFFNNTLGYIMEVTLYQWWKPKYLKDLRPSTGKTIKIAIEHENQANYAQNYCVGSSYVF